MLRAPYYLLGRVEAAAHTPEPIDGLDMAAFGLEVDGQSLHFGWEFVGTREAAGVSVMRMSQRSVPALLYEGLHLRLARPLTSELLLLENLD